MVATSTTPVTDELKSKVREEIADDLKSRREALRMAIRAVENVVEVACHSDSMRFAGLVRRLWKLLMVVGLRAVECFCASKRGAPTSNRAHDEDERCFRYRTQKRFQLRCVFGEGEFIGSQFIRGKNARSGDEFCPLLAACGLLPMGGGFGPGLASECVRMASVCAFEPAKNQLERFLGYVPSTRALQGLVDRLGPAAEEVLEQAPCPPGDVLVVQLDGRGLPRITEDEYERRCRPHGKGEDARPCRRRNESRFLDSKRGVGKNKSSKREVTVGIIYGLDRVEGGGWERSLNQHYYARMGDREGVMAHLSEVVERQESPPSMIMFLSDGVPQYAVLREEYLPGAKHILDYYHVCDYLWDAACALGKTEVERDAWVGVLKGLLRKGKASLVETILREDVQGISKRGPGTKAKREALEAARDYIGPRRDMMPYDELLEEGLEIGSGAVESAVRQVVELRFDGPGMRWGGDRPNRMLPLVCARLSGLWSELEEHVERMTRRRDRIRRITPKGVQERRNERAAA